MALLTGQQQTGGQVRDADGRTVVGLDSTSNLAATVSDAVSSTLAANATTGTAGASAPLVPANAGRKGLQVTVDPAATANVYFLLGAGTASATAFHFALGAGGSWDGTVSNTVWTGAVQFFSSGTPKVGVAEV